MPASPPLCTEAEITALVHQFYARIRVHEDLGPFFNGHIDDWHEHLDRLCDFWSSVLLGSGRFSGAPMPKHVALPGLKAELFHQWLALWRSTAAEQPNQRLAEQAVAAAERIAQSLWMGYQAYAQGVAVPRAL